MRKECNFVTGIFSIDLIEGENRSGFILSILFNVPIESTMLDQFYRVIYVYMYFILSMKKKWEKLLPLEIQKVAKPIS